MSDSRLDSTRRFSSRVADYVKYRPGYPQRVVEVCRDSMGLTRASMVADIGSGTGISTELFLKNGNVVYGVEPNPDMRGAAEQLLSHRYTNFHSVDGTAEATTLPDAAADLVIAAQAFHWFDKSAAAREFRRVLRPSGHVVIVWNDRKTYGSPLLAGYDQLLQTVGTDYKQVSKTTTSVEDLHDVFGVPFRRVTFPNEQHFDFEGFEGRAMSASYSPLSGHAAHGPFIAGLRELFDAHQKDGQVVFEYETEVFFGRLK
ncbi:MAG: methyltransferase domain-containing protein [Planctomycetota bacterium]|nr:methyltransferase domain-containing protein [Planctomycetota bacterium]